MWYIKDAISHLSNFQVALSRFSKINYVNSAKLANYTFVLTQFVNGLNFKSLNNTQVSKPRDNSQAVATNTWLSISLGRRFERWQTGTFPRLDSQTDFQAADGDERERLRWHRNSIGCHCQHHLFEYLGSGRKISCHSLSRGRIGITTW